MEIRALDRLAAAFLLVVMAIGALALWIAVPSGCLYLSSKLTDSLAGHFVVALPMTLAAMILWGAILFWINGLYLRITGFYTDPEDPDEPPRRIRGPLEPMLIVSLVFGLVALFVWFFVFAENPSPLVF